MRAVELNALSLRPDGAGVSTYVRELLHAMPVPWQAACTALVQSDALGELPGPVAVRTVPPQSGVRRALTGLRHRADRDTVFHGMDVDLPLRHRGPSVTTVHDLSVFDTPWAHDPVRVRGERLLIAHAMRTADIVLAVSNFTAERVEARFGRTSRVTPLAAARDMVPATVEAIAAVRVRHALPDRFVLHVGTVEPRKDVPLLAEACRLVGLPLVLAGGGGGKVSLGSGVHRLGFVPRRELPALYGAATVTAYVSRYEGFGLPPVEALACGANVVCSRVADLPLHLGQDVTWLLSPVGADLARALRAAAHDPPGGSAPRLSWSRTAADTVTAYEHLGAVPARGAGTVDRA